MKQKDDMFAAWIEGFDQPTTAAEWDALTDAVRKLLRRLPHLISSDALGQWLTKNKPEIVAAMLQHTEQGIKQEINNDRVSSKGND